MDRQLTGILDGMKASYPYFNPRCPRLPKRVEAPSVLASRQVNRTVEFRWKNRKAKVVRANLIYTTNGGQRTEEWFRKPAALTEGNRGSVVLPEGATHYIINLIDSNNFLVSFPEIDPIEGKSSVKSYSELALKVD